MGDRSEWAGLVSGRTNATELRLTAVLGEPKATASSPFIGLAEDGQRWWIKAPQPQLAKALVTELIVGKLGALIGSPVCQVATIRIGPELLPHDLRPGLPLSEGVGTATLDLRGTATEIRGTLNRREDDDNSVRHAGIYALVDWCFGSDLQWLQLVDDDWKVFSHDHGWYLPPSGPDWREADLIGTVDTAASIPGDSPSGLDSFELKRLATALDNVDRPQLATVLNHIPTEMPVTDHELECLGWFLETRAPAVAARLRAIEGGSQYA
jgi:hypothetical protein